jgi:hypothetical protein
MVCVSGGGRGRGGGHQNCPLQCFEFHRVLKFEGQQSPPAQSVHPLQEEDKCFVFCFFGGEGGG